MEKKKYDKLYRKAFNKVSKEQYFPYSKFSDYIRQFDAILEEKLYKKEIDKELLELCKLYALKWGVMFFSCHSNDKEGSVLFSGIFNTIANDILAIINLLLDGLEYQAYIVLRNLYEVSLTLLVIMLDNNKRDLYFASAKNENEYEVWKRYFTHKRIDEALKAYEETLAFGEELSLLREWRISSYEKYSGYVHNNFFNMLSHSMTSPLTNDENEILDCAVWGGVISRANRILMDMADLLYYTDLLFMNILVDQGINFCKEDLVNEERECKEFWNIASELAFILNEYYLEIKERLGEDKDL